MEGKNNLSLNTPCSGGFPARDGTVPEGLLRVFSTRRDTRVRMHFQNSCFCVSKNSTNYLEKTEQIFYGLQHSEIRRSMKDKDERFNKRLLEGIALMSSVLDVADFIDPVKLTDILQELKPLRGDAKSRSHNILYKMGIVNSELKDNLEAFSNKYDSFRNDATEHNKELLSRKSVEVGDLINPVEGRDLDRQQLSSIAFDIRSRLVIAGAGTGKTTTIIGLVKYLLKTGLAHPEEILLLSFTNASVNELKQRIIAETGERIDTNTFHRLGLKIIASADGKVPKISSADLNRFIKEEIERRRSDPRYLKALNEYLAYDYDSQKKESDFKSYSEYLRYLEENPLITLNGEKVKSFGEADIANFLAINGIPYEYEESYPIDTNDSQYGQYHPDFHLTGTNIYIEYFGTDRDGNVAKFMIDDNPDASEEYRQGIEWKKQIHQANNTKLIDLYAYNRSEGELQSELENKLRKLKVQFNPDSPSDTLRKNLGQDDMKLNALVSMFTTIILLVKGHGKKWEETFPQGESRGERKQLKRLENVIKPLYDAYQKSLRDNEEIDFEDMLNLATYCIEKGGFTHSYKYVIVDEYQDLSLSRYNLLRALRESKDYKLFCVGDDWQSIYRFNGCDVSYILDFEKYWGPSGICKIETTYRFTGDLLKLSTEFICRNKRQYPKNLMGAGKENCSVNPILAPSPFEARKMLAHIVSTIPEGSSVLFLGRYNHDVRLLNSYGFTWKPDIADKTSILVKYDRRPDLTMRFMTIHGSKGLQANYVFTLNNKTGSFGFPSNRVESPVISMLLGGRDTQLDEERRLFYVAMTRANRALYLLSYEGHESQFYRELFGGPAFKRNEIGYCPICGGSLVLRDGRYGAFYGCSNYHSRGCKFKRTIEKEKTS